MMARADLLKKLFEAYQRLDDQAFRQVAAEVIEDERKKQHPVLANDLQRVFANGVRSMEDVRGMRPAFDPVPVDSERRTPLLTVRTPDRYFDDLVLEPGIRTALDRVLTEVRGWEILDAHGLTPTRHLLLCGPSGCGKTASAEVLAAELALPMLYVRFDSVVSSLLGETAANLRKVFDYVARGQWIVFFDEFDAIGRSRDDATEHGEIKRVVNSFLQLLDNFLGRSLIIAATNFEQALDPAIWRRFDDVLRLDLPSKEALQALIAKRLRPLRSTKKQVEALVEKLDGATFADAERVCFDARKACALDGSVSLRNADIDVALERFAYRRSVLQQAAPDNSTPLVDRG
jgi:SpoVK/Ycf46/Vps4 family AAA+-type ATPase